MLNVSREIKTGVIVLIIIVLFFFGFNFLKNKNLYDKTRTFYAEYEQRSRFGGQKSGYD